MYQGAQDAIAPSVNYKQENVQVWTQQISAVETLLNQCLQQLLALKYAITEMIILRKVRSNRRMAENIIFPLDYGWAQSEKNIP